jgi:hypothetical protein
MIFLYASFYHPVVLRKFKSKAQTLKKALLSEQVRIEK